MSKLRTRFFSCILIFVMCASFLTGCDNGISTETKKAVMEKTNEALALYADIEKLSTDNKLAMSDSFVTLKSQLSSMSVNVKTKIEKTTEADGQNSLVQLNKLIDKLKSIKDRVTKSLS